MFAVILLLYSFNAKASLPDNDNSIPNDSNKICLVEDDQILSMLDSLAFTSYLKNYTFVTDTSLLNKYHFPVNYVPEYTDSVYALRLAKLAQNTPCELFYDEDVRKYIDVYAKRKKNLTARVLGLAELYFPYFEEALAKYNMPLEIKYLAIIESALNPFAISRANAGGLWQFIPGTGRAYKLKVNSVVDDRFDLYKSTDAACRHLKDLYKLYHNWDLCLAAYNSGAGCVNRAIARSGGKKTFNEIKRFLPKETRAYVPAFIAVNYIMNYATEHNIYPVAPSIYHYEIDTITIKQRLSFEQISEMLNIPYQDVVSLNPAYRRKYIPADKDNPYIIRLPKEHVAAFINNETALYAFKAKNPNKETIASKFNYKSKYSDIHIVRKGESLSKIARTYNCSITELKVWNKLKTMYLRPGQKLLVLNPKEQSTDNSVQ